MNGWDVAVVAKGEEPQEGELTYESYLKHPAWKLRREFALSYFHHRCCICGRSSEETSLEIHHRSYVDYETGESIVGRERLEHLTCVCKKCHYTRVHRYKKNGFTPRQSTLLRDGQEND